MKVCSRCKKLTPLDRMVKNRSTKDGYSSYCKPCGVLNSQEARVRSGWKPAKPGMTPEEYRAHRRNKRLMKLYGITVQQRDEMAAKGCWICGIKETGRWGTLHVDHCHSTGKVRGVLCTGCNRAIGYLDDDPDRAEALAAYLRHGGKAI